MEVPGTLPGFGNFPKTDIMVSLLGNPGWVS